MKKLLIILLTCLSTTVPGQTIPYDTIRYAREYYKTRMDVFKTEPIVKGKVILLGNSLTEFGDWQKLLNDPTAVNRGIAADNTFGVLERLDDVISRQPKKLFIEIGINDISQNIPDAIVVNNILTMVKRVREGSPQTHIWIVSILPTNDNVKKEYPDAFNKFTQTNSVNSRLKQAAKENGFTYIDLAKVLSDTDGKLDVRYADPDGLHLNDAGYHQWIDLLKNLKAI
jgi:lysophospholipase L1-like esterase